MSARYNSFFVLSLATALAFAPAFANAPPNAAPRTPVTVQELPPVSAPSQPVAAAPAPAPAAVPAERPLWRRPELYAWIALFATFAASATTLLYLRRPDQNVLRAAAALTAASGVFVAAALVAWLV